MRIRKEQAYLLLIIYWQDIKPYQTKRPVSRIQLAATPGGMPI